MTTDALIVVLMIVGLLANAALIYVALSRLRQARDVRHVRAPAVRSIHDAWQRPGEPEAAAHETARITRVRAVPPPAPRMRHGAGSEAEEDRALAAAITDFVRSAQVMTRSDEPSTPIASSPGPIDPPPGLEAKEARAVRASVVVVDIQAGSGRSGLGQAREIEVSVDRALRRTARDVDQVRRLGAASFAVLLAGTRGPGADAFVGRARKAVADVLAPYRGSTFTIAAADVGDDPDEALHRAIQSLDAKHEEHDERPKRRRPVSP